MKKKLIPLLQLAALVISPLPNYAQLAPSPMGGGLGGSRIEHLSPLNPAQGKGNASQNPPGSPPRQTPLQPVPQIATYLHPGILVLTTNGWEGGDHLLNISSAIGVYVSVIKPEGDNLELSEILIQKQIEEIFKKGGITPLTFAPPGMPPLPAFQIQILVYPIDKGYVASCTGRLFESVNLQRFRMDPGMAFQAITWEKMSLQVGPTASIIAQIQNCSHEIANSLVERFQQFEQIKRNIR